MGTIENTDLKVGFSVRHVDKNLWIQHPSIDLSPIHLTRQVQDKCASRLLSNSTRINP